MRESAKMEGKTQQRKKKNNGGYSEEGEEPTTSPSRTSHCKHNNKEIRQRLCRVGEGRGRRPYKGKRKKKRRSLKKLQTRQCLKNLAKL